VLSVRTNLFLLQKRIIFIILIFFDSQIDIIILIGWSDHDDRKMHSIEFDEWVLK